MHHWSCDWHLDQVPADCCCDAARPAPTWFMQPEQARDLVRDPHKVSSASCAIRTKCSSALAGVALARRGGAP